MAHIRITLRSPLPSVHVSIQEEPQLDLATFIEQLFGDVQTAAQTIAPLVAVIGFIGLGVMYMSSSWPIIGDWKGRP